MDIPDQHPLSQSHRVWAFVIIGVAIFMLGFVAGRFSVESYRVSFFESFAKSNHGRGHAYGVNQSPTISPTPAPTTTIVSSPTPTPIVSTQPLVGDPRYLVMNIAWPGGSWDNVDWSKSTWESTPLQTLTQMKSALGTTGNSQRRLAFSWTGVLYLNNSVSTTTSQINKLFQLARDADVPVMIPLGDVTWWGNRPDLWNWFDPSKPGYNANNINNVEWSCFDPSCASKDSWRNWGSGFWLGFPAPNYASPVVRAELQNRLQQIAPTILQNIASLQRDGKEYLFAGVKMGWEASIGINNACNQQALDNQNTCYGYRSYMNQHCSSATPLCKTGSTKPSDFNATLVTTIQQYLELLAKTLFDAGIPKDRIYSHGSTIWEHGALSYAPASFNNYSRPAWSLYPPYSDPNTILKSGLQAHGFPAWGVGESNLFATNNASAWSQFINSVLNNTSTPNGHMLGLYNWGDPYVSNATTLTAIKNFLNGL